MDLSSLHKNKYSPRQKQKIYPILILAEFNLISCVSKTLVDWVLILISKELNVWSKLKHTESKRKIEITFNIHRDFRHFSYQNLLASYFCCK